MAHVFVLVEGRELWTDIFLNDLLKRRYQYKMSNGQQGMIQPNPREIRFFDVTIPEEAIPKLLDDIGYAENSSPLRGKIMLVAESVRIAAGLNSMEDLDPPKGRLGALSNWLKEKIGIRKKPKYEYPDWEALGPKGVRPNVRKQWLNIIPIGWARDKKVGDDANAYLPKGGELL